MATVQELINYLQQFHPNDTVWVLGKNPKAVPTPNVTAASTDKET